MITSAVNGREALFAQLDEELFPAGLPSPIFHTMSPTPVAHTMFDPVSSTQPAPPTTPQESSDIPLDGKYFDDQWHFDFLGDIETIWEEYSGFGVHVGVYDDGLQYSHPDLGDNYDPSRQVTVGGELLDPDYYASLGFAHGTSVAGLIGATRNEFGTTGVAWGSSLTGVPIFYGPADINSDYEGFLEAVDQTENFDIVNHSWGKLPFFWQHPQVWDQDTRLIAEWMEAVENGREGLGTVIVKAAGNDDRNANGDLGATSRASIVVGAYDDDGDASYYSNFGSNLLVSAPSSGGFSFLAAPSDWVNTNRGVVTTDLLGVLNGYDIVDPDLGYVEGDYTNAFGGTSAATPIVSGVVALMLEANPDLGWRDVQNILAYSAREVGSGVGGARTADEDHDWRYNGAGNWNGGGLHYSEDYGYGSVEAYNAVRMAEVWGLFAAPQASANETSYSSTATNVALNDLQTTDIQFYFDGSSFDVESVSISLNITHSSRSEEIYYQVEFGFLNPYLLDAFLSDLEITLISPNGTETLLADFGRDIATDDPALYGTDQWKGDFLANAFRGEDGIGTWTLRIKDSLGGDSGTVNSATLTLHGRDGDAAGQSLNDDVYHYTNEVFETLGRVGANDSRRTITDDDGGTDWINLAAMSGDLVVRLGAGESSTGTTTSGSVREIFKIGAGTAIENVVTGDGDDHLYGNALANKLYGMRGNDALSGGAGADTLSGGAGNDTLTGGADQDVFLFDRALDPTSNVDIIADFSHLDDTFWLDIAIFSGIAAGMLSADAFYVGTSAQDEFDRIIYDALTGALYYDADGSNSAFSAIEFATLDGHPTDLSWNDFEIVSTDPETISTVTDRTTTADPTIVRTDVDEPSSDGTPIVGGEGNDTLRAKDLNDRIFGLGGGDMLTGGAGDDYIDGGADVDAIRGGDGNDTLIGGGSSWRWGDYIGGGAGDDLIIGSNDQPNDTLELLLGQRGDLLEGNEGNDRIYGLDGDDQIFGQAGNDILDGGKGSDSISGGSGDDRIIAGEGERDIVAGNDGFDTVVFSGNFADYRFYFEPYEQEFMTVERLGQTSEVISTTRFFIADVEALEFADGTIDLQSRPSLLANVYDPADGESITFNNWEVGLNLFRAGEYDIYDDGPADRLQYVNIVNWNFGLVRESDITIHSDALTLLEVGGFEGSLTVDAAAGERELTLKLNPEVFAFDNPDADSISDNTATSVNFMSQWGGMGGGNNVNYFNGAAVNGYNLSFALAETIAFTVHEMNTKIQWYIPNVTTIDVTENRNRVGFIVEGGNSSGNLTIETALDDSLLATAGGSAEFRFIGGDVYEGSELIRFGNLGAVNLSNDGSFGEEKDTNAGLGLRGAIDLGAGSDEAWILGTGAFQGGTLDGGAGVDFLRMNFAVAAAIGDINEHITGFEAIRLTMPTLAGQVVDVTKFGNLDNIEVIGTSVAGGDNTIMNIADNATVTFASGTEATEKSIMDFEVYGNQFGTVHLDLAGDGDNDTLNLSFVGYAIDSYDNGARPVGLDEGTVHVLDAETVNITTAAYDEATFILDIYSQPTDYLSYDPTDPFNQVLDLDVTESVHLAGETGWDFTVEGTDIGKVTLLDASGVTGFGAVGAVKAIAQTSEGVTFKGGFGDDQLTGGAGDDTLDGGGYGNDLLDGGAGIDKAVFAGNWADYAITIDNGIMTLANASDGTTDTVRGVELFKFADKELSANALLTGVENSAPEDIALSNATIAEFADDGTVVGTLSATDPDTGDTLTYQLVDDAGGRFAIEGNKIVVADGAALDFEIDASHEVTVKVTDQGGLSVEKTFTIAVGDVNETPTIALTPVLTSIAENTATTSPIKVADIVVADPDSNPAYRSNSLSLTGRDAGLFQIIGMALFLKAGVVLDYEQRQSLEVAVQVDDPTIGSGPDGSADFTLAITDVVDENAILGTPGNNDLRGTNGDDYFDGRGGRDSFRGYRGDDTYVVDSTNDSVIERRHEGTDTVLSSVNHTLADNVENLVLTGHAAINGTGNDGDNVITGNDNNNRLYGGSGDDVIEGGLGDDVMDGGRGTDTTSYTGAAGPVKVSLALFGAQNTGVGFDTLLNFENLTGSAFDDWLAGDRYDNVINGGIGADDMTGGKGDDIYIVDNAGDVIHEAAYQGTDTVRSSVSHTLAANVENLILTGTAAIDGTGNDLANKIIGNAAGNTLSGLGGDDTIYGGVGADKLIGGAGNDWLKGGGGADTFVFNTVLSSWSNRDVIDDYTVSDDTIWLDNAIFTALAGAEDATLSADQFWKGAGAHDASDRIIYNPWTGVLSYDSNGSAHGGAVEIAILSKGLAMTNAEFVIV